MSEAKIQVSIGVDAPIEFAKLSGDWNRLHTDAAYAAGTTFGRQVLHGAYLTGLMSQLAGMHLPGEACLLHGMAVRFIAPVLPPVRLTVLGELVSGTMRQGRVAVRVVGTDDGTRYAEGHYDFGVHGAAASAGEPVQTNRPATDERDIVLVTGASGELARAMLAKLGERGLGVSRSKASGNVLQAATAEEIETQLETGRIAAIVHCAWPHPDNEALTRLADVRAATEHHVAAPVRQIIDLAQLLRRRGTDNALLLLVGSTAADPGRHNYRMPLYTLGKSLVPTLASILAMELGGPSRRCVAVVFDVIEGGMNRQMSAAAKIAHKDRSPFGRVASPAEAADQLLWVLNNKSYLASGSTLVLTGGAAP